MRYYKFALHKGYFEKGLSVTNFFKYPIALIGVTNYAYFNNVNITIIMVIFYFIFCYVFGWAWYNKGFVDAENEVSNQFNPFQKEMRKAHKTKHLNIR